MKILYIKIMKLIMMAFPKITIKIKLIKINKMISLNLIVNKILIFKIKQIRNLSIYKINKQKIKLL